jgi:hypothetical protein
MASARAQHRVAYYHDEMVGTIYYGQQHPMKPHRVAMTHNLVVNYKMDEQMDVFVRMRLFRPCRAPASCRGLFSRPERCRCRRALSIRKWRGFMRQSTSSSSRR